MSDDYLWDPSGKPDPEIQRLERALSPLRYDAADVPVAPIRRWPRRVQVALFMAACLAAGVALTTRRAPPPRVAEQPAAMPADAFEVTRNAGTPTVDGAPVGAKGVLAVGQWIETDGSSRAEIARRSLGVVSLAEGTRLRLTASGPDQQRLDLERGQISARVVAPPRVFVVGTPAATAVDLGCAYTLSVDDAGAGLLHVTSGWVALEDKGRASYVPAGASCATRRGKGPGTPTYDDAPSGLRDDLERFDFDAGGDPAVTDALAAARPRDALSVWHLLPRVGAAMRRVVYRRLATLAAPPAGITEDQVLELDELTLTRWRDALLAREGAAVTW